MGRGKNLVCFPRFRTCAVFDENADRTCGVRRGSPGASLERSYGGTANIARLRALYYGPGMVTPSALQRSTEERLARARVAFERFYLRCFWYMRRDAVITEENLPYIIERLRADGGQAGFAEASELCR